MTLPMSEMTRATPLSLVLAGIPDRSDVERALLAVVPREGTRPDRLSAPETDQMRQAGVLGAGGGLTSRGVALRAMLLRRVEDRDFAL
jgi:hypothetical protein